MSTELGSFLRKAIADKNITRKELCERTGISEATISRLISGERGKAPSPETMNRLAAGLGIPLEVLAKRSGFDFDQKIIQQITDTEEIIKKITAPIINQIYNNTTYLMSLFNSRNIETTPEKAKTFLNSLPPSKQLKFLQDSGFVFSFSDSDNHAELKTTFPAEFVKSKNEAEILAGAMQENFAESIAYVTSHQSTTIPITIAKNSIFEGNRDKLQRHINNIDQMDPVIAEKALQQIESTSALFPRATHAKPINIFPEKSNDKEPVGTPVRHLGNGDR